MRILMKPVIVITFGAIHGGMHLSTINWQRGDHKYSYRIEEEPPLYWKFLSASSPCEVIYQFIKQINMDQGPDLGEELESPRSSDQLDKLYSQVAILECRKSDFISNVDRETMAEKKDLFWQVGVSGLIGMGLPYVAKEKVYENKKQIEREVGQTEQEYEAMKSEEISKKLRANNSDFLRNDGIFASGQETGTAAINQRRLEQALITEEKFHYFDKEGEFIMDKEFFEERMQRIFILDYQENPCHATFQRSATLCARVNQNKIIPFKLEIFIGVLEFTYHPQFTREDQLVSDLRYLIRKYRSRADLALLPHYKKTKDILQKELSELQNRQDYPKKEIQMIKQELDKTEKLFNDEKKLLQNISEQIYTIWGKIKEERQMHDYVGTPYKLVVRQYTSNENTNEIEFLLQQCDVNMEQTHKKQQVQRQEIARRQLIQQFPVIVHIVINNQVVAKSGKTFLQWPSFQVSFMQKLQVYVFTKPSAIKLRIYQAKLIPKLIDTIEIEIPGEKSNAITSAGFVLKEAYFACGREQVRNTRYARLVNMSFAGQEQNKLEHDEFEFEGFISYRTEWAGFGPSMPPDSMDMQYEEMDQKYQDEEEELIEYEETDTSYFDVNDPRNDDLLAKLQQLRNEQRDLFKSDCQVPLSQIISLRQRLLKLRFIQPTLQKYQIPMMQEMIRLRNELVQFIEDDDQQRNYELELNRQQKEGGPQILEDFITEPLTRKRLMIIQSILNQRKIEARLKKSSHAGSLLNLENVVNEFHFEAAASLLAECIKQIFTKRRKLGPKKRSQLDKKNVSQISEVQISVLIVQANNVPIRSSVMDQLGAIKENITQLSSIRETIDQLFKLRKVSPTMQLRMDIDSKNVYVIRYEERKEKEVVQSSQRQQQQDMFGMREEQQNQQEGIEDVKLVQRRIAEGKSQIENTSEVEGINPEWNELIDFRIGRKETNQSFDPQDVINSRNKIVMTLYDQIGSVRQEPNNPDRFKLVIKRHFLGQVTIPLLSLFQNEKISGTFRVQRPIMMLNYQTLKVDQFLNEPIQRDEQRDQNNQITLHKNNNIIDPHVPTTVELSMTLDPAIKVNEQFASTDYFPGAEQTNLFLYGVRHLERLMMNPLLQRRNIKFWAENLKGESVFLPRYLHPLQPPQMNYEANAIEKAARYVSLIPFKNDTEHFQDLPDIYCDAQEFLDLRAGDFEEHAILLCCYFLYIDHKIFNRKDVQSYVVMGQGLPEGSTQYVLRRLKTSNFVELWNPQTGEPFVFQNVEEVKRILCFPVSRGFRNLNNIEDQACPLKAIGCVFDDQNVYVNIQQSDDPAEISFDIDDPSKWEPVLNKDQIKTFYPKGMETIQKEVAYDPVDIDRSLKVQEELEKYLMERIENHRKTNLQGNKGSFATRFVTQKYAEFTSYIRDQMLLHLESFKFRIRTTGLAVSINRLNNLLKERHVRQTEISR